MRKVRSLLLQHGTLFIVCIIITIAASIHLYALGYSHLFGGILLGVEVPPRSYSHYNNYVIFKNSFYNLIAGRDLYILYPEQQWDLYKYSPTFALAMGALAWMPDSIGMTIWNLVNALALFAAMRMLPFGKKTMALAFWFILVELLTSVQSTQSNALIAAAMIGAWGFMERGKSLWATLLLVMATYIKVYGAVGFAIFLFYPQKPRFILYAALWTVLFAITPLAVTTPGQLVAQYESWINMMRMDQSISYGLSVMGWLHSWFGINSGKELVMLMGVILFFIPLLRWKVYKEQGFRLLFLAFMLVWVIIFNHKAESSTFIIAVAGVAVWYFAKQPRSLWHTVILWLVFIFTCLSPSDIFPPAARVYMIEYMIKAVPCILVWCILLYELVTYKPGSKQLSE